MSETVSLAGLALGVWIAFISEEIPLLLGLRGQERMHIGDILVNIKTVLI